MENVLKVVNRIVVRGGEEVLCSILLQRLVGKDVRLIFNASMGLKNSYQIGIFKYYRMLICNVGGSKSSCIK